jgi:hypothetical protein
MEVTGKFSMSTDPGQSVAPTCIAFLAIAQAHQFLHWLPTALRLAREPGVEVTVLGASPAGLDFIRSYDPEGRLKLKRLKVPSLSPDGLFTPPRRRLTLLLNQHIIRRYPTIVTTETTSGLLKRIPGFRSRLIHLKHGAGDREGGYNPKHRFADLTLVNGPKDKERLIARGLATAENCEVVGYAKFELARAPERMFPNNNPVAFYNPHFDARLSSWFRHGEALVRQMEAIPDWNFIVAPHVKLKGGPDVRSTSPNVLIDRGSIRSIDMTYTESANVYIGDISSQVYEFLRRPRPCIFLNLDHIDWRSSENYLHWRLGTVIERVEELGPALAAAEERQPGYEQPQRELTAKSLDPSPVPASERQARAILDFIARTQGEARH